MDNLVEPYHGLSLVNIELCFCPICVYQTRSKRFLEIQKLRENKKDYDVKTAVSLLKQMASTKFIESAEAHFRLNIDPKYNDQQLRATVSYRIYCNQITLVYASTASDVSNNLLQVNLPKGTGQVVRVAVLTQGFLLFSPWFGLAYLGFLLR